MSGHREEARQAPNAPAEVEHVSHRGGQHVTGRKCRTCKRPGQEFASPLSRRCNECTRKAEERSECRGCGLSLPLNGNGEPRRWCGRKACRYPIKAPPPTHVCPGCLVEKPRDLEHFGIMRRRDDGSIALDSTCRSCRRGLANDRYWSSEAYREQSRARTAAAHERIQKRREEDPEFDEEFRRRRRDWARARRERGPQAGPTAAEQGKTKGGSLAGPPMAALMRSQALRTNRSLLELCEAIGVPDRRIRAWEAGEGVSPGVVDQVLVYLGLNWWDVYDPHAWGSLGMTPLEWIDAVDGASVAFDGEHLV